jgi:hypothetical protein
MLDLLPVGLIPFQSFELDNAQSLTSGNIIPFVAANGIEQILLREKTSSLLYLEEVEISIQSEVGRPNFVWFLRVAGIGTRHLENRRLTQTSNQKTLAYPRLVIQPQTEVIVGGIIDPVFNFYQPGSGLGVQVILRGSLVRFVRRR